MSYMKKAILTIRTIGDECLRQPSLRLQSVGPGERILIQAMIETMYAAEGVGLAAPQVGINKQIFVVDIGNGPLVFINLEIVDAYGSCVKEEGCLSVPEGCVKVERPEKIRVKFWDSQGKECDMECSGLLARVVQHENDHLMGKLIVDYADAKEQEELAVLFPDVKF